MKIDRLLNSNVVLLQIVIYGTTLWQTSVRQGQTSDLIMIK